MDSSAEAPRPAGARVIKRYANRKLYDTRDSRYVTLREIEALVRSGEDVRIIDNGTKEDLTSVTLAQVLLEQEKKGGKLLPSALRDLIHSRGEKIIASIREGAVGKLIRRGDAAEAPAPTPPQATPTRRVAEAIAEGREALDEWQKRIDERIRAALQTLVPWAQLQAEVKRLSERVDALERDLREARGGGE